MPTILAEAKGEWTYQIVVFIVVMVLFAVRKLIEYIKTSQQRQQEQRQQHSAPELRQAQSPEPQRAPVPGSQRTQAPQQAQSVEEIVRTMRQAGRPQHSSVPPVPRQAQIPKARVAQRRPQPRPQELADRHVIPAAKGQGVDAETARLQKHLRREQVQVEKRVVGQPLGLLTRAAEGVAAREPRSVVQINLADLAEARRGIIYAEIRKRPGARKRVAFR